MGAVPAALIGTASGVANTFRQVSTVFGVALAGALVQLQAGSASPTSAQSVPGSFDSMAFLQGMYGSLIVSALGCLLATICTLWLMKKKMVLQNIAER